MADSAGYAHNEISYAKMSLSYAHTYASACPKNGRLREIPLRAPHGGTEGNEQKWAKKALICFKTQGKCKNILRKT